VETQLVGQMISLRYLRRTHERRLFDDHVFAVAAHHFRGMFEVHAGGSDHGHRIDVGKGAEHVALVHEEGDVEFPAVDLGLFPDEIADRQKLDAFRSHDGPAMMASDAPAPDYGNFDNIFFHRISSSSVTAVYCGFSFIP
jgi:hypothetical protein